MCVFVRALCFGDVGRVCSVEAVVGCGLTEKNAATTRIQVRQRGYRMCGAPDFITQKTADVVLF